MSRSGKEPIFPHAAPMKTLYSRLKDAGYDAPFVRQFVLPEWWEDKLASNPANKALAEIAVSRVLGFAIPELRNEQKRLQPALETQFRLKRRKDATSSELAPTIRLAERVAIGIVSALANIPGFIGRIDASSARSAVLKRSEAVNLAALLEFAWESGVVVLRLGKLPKCKRPSGIAMFVGQRPVVMLCSGHDSPSWLAFHLAHELAHVLLGHVTAGNSPLADGSLDSLGGDGEEKAADEFAFRLIAGGEYQRPAVPEFGLTAPKLARQAFRKAGELHADAGFLALAYGLSTGRMPVAQNALKELSLDRGGHALIDNALRRRLPSELSETVERFVALSTAE